MRILALNFERGWRGGERQTLYNTQGLIAAGITTHLLCRKGQPLEAAAKKAGITVHAFASKMAVLGFLIKHGAQYNILHAQTSQILTYCVVTKWFHGAAVVFTRRINKPQSGLLTQLKYKYTNKLVAISSAIKQTLASFTKRCDIEVISDVVVPKPADKERISTLRNQQYLTGKTIIGTTAAFTAEKDPFTMLNAVEILRSLEPNFVFLHFGSGPMLAKVETAAKAKGLEQHYRFMGFENDVEAIIPLFDLFVISSKQEGLGSSVLDAFAHKVPVVATNAGGLAALVNKERGISCAVGDAAALAAAMQHMLHHPEQAKLLANNAYEYVHEEHSLQSITQKYLTLFNSTVATATV
ncbi:MAG: glycosyltransferase [Chitinophagaceae bacterium]|nr:MAG: glycosyltransferase [Chitinophagaceae bacterium]